MASPGQDYVVWPQGAAFASLAKAVACAKKHAESRYVEGSRNLKVYWRANPQTSIVRDKWVSARIKVTKAGKILAKVAPAAVTGANPKRKRKGWFMDSAGVFRQIRDYDAVGGTKPKRKPAAVKRATPKRKAKRR